jgi:ferredoxin
VVMEFIEKADFGSADYIFAVITRGAPIQGGVLGHLKILLAKKGKKLSAGFYVNMPSNYIPWFEVKPPEQQVKIFKKASEKVSKIAKAIKNEERKVERELLFFMRDARHKPFLAKLGHIDKDFYTDDHCNGCGICGKVCRFANIILEEGKPAWRHNCQLCLACINYCPKQAIQFGNATVMKGRYHHPEVNVSEYIGK